jgi:ferredoxin-like protein FixX
MYYLRSRPATNAIKFTVDVEALLKENCEGFELKHFNSTQPAKEESKAGVSAGTQIVAEKENIDVNVLQVQSSSESNIKAGDQEKKPMAACPLRKKKKNSDGEIVEDDGECLACGS